MKHSYYKKLKKAKDLLKPKAKDRCRSCHKEFAVDDLIYGPDPFAEEINNDHTPTVLCKECYQESCWDI